MPDNKDIITLICREYTVYSDLHLYFQNYIYIHDLHLHINNLHLYIQTFNYFFNIYIYLFTF